MNQNLPDEVKAQLRMPSKRAFMYRFLRSWPIEDLFGMNEVITHYYSETGDALKRRQAETLINRFIALKLVERAEVKGLFRRVK